MLTLQKLTRASVVLTFPALCLLLLVFAIPIVQLFLNSINAPALSLVNYVTFFVHPANVRVLIQTIEVSIVATVICAIIGYPTAYLITAASKQVRSVLVILVLIPYLTSSLARTYAWVMILGDRGLINNLLLDLRVITSPLPLIYNRMAMYIGMVHIMLPIMILPLVSVMLGIDKSQVAAARSMGARPFSAFWRVFLPLSLPGLRSGALLVFILSLGFYITPAALGGLRDAMLSTFIAAEVQSSFNLGRIGAASFILLAIAMTVLAVLRLNPAGPKGNAASDRRNRFPAAGALVRHLTELGTLRRARRWNMHLYRAGDATHVWRFIGITVVIFTLLFLLFPGVVVIIVSFSAGTQLEFPPSGFSVQWYRSFFADPSWNGAALSSFEIAISVTIISTILGTLAAYGLSRSAPMLRNVLTLVLLAPITFPVIVVGIAAYLGLVSFGLVGSKTGIVLAHSIGAMSYVVVVVAATLANFDISLEQAAKSMRAGPFRTFMRVTLPLIRPGILGGAVFAFLHSFDEVVISLLVSGLSIRTLPLKMWENIRHEIDPTVAAVASLLMLLPVLWLVAMYFIWWRSRSRMQAASARMLAAV
ncbi:MAG: ABC transporter permease subunit [Mesorhizobium sp.]|uniref:ABC transporter permease subunit n=3 Tax=Mesorhizobium TaxID=68287 RepID=UPI000F7599C8|nr:MULTISPECIES: ABC transporter permease subunit [unclassified Mesorhizobium]RVC70751.1 ABC transporter permease subunit [Mesorhizobium sp. M00.F.Ca.ET.038.03.1.1]AZO36004.1 ABC transporter permease subunit [Mesorhizobium sp. M2A.F.Ca.ET.046.03.2.1]AZO73063.1 ABC transporter permease subunit [Mesorhizobium sp. M1D.F.Ca.ET.043.01.1.1]RUV17546.1 ABC transporter permease subunit [Mesorhizobium sp. M7A.F.Ca.MR.245.00.0.0]RUV35269.1 ABC transporter permease subunit [Mesorhizobium sp. M7A.F.Ca.MR.1